MGCGTPYFKHYCKCVFCVSFKWENHTRKDILRFESEKHDAELEKDLIIGEHVNNVLKTKIIGIINNLWDCFAKEGFYRTIFG